MANIFSSLGGGGGQGQQGSQSSSPVLPPALRNIVSAAERQYTGAQGALPDMAALYKMFPQLQVPTMSGTETGLLNTETGTAGAGPGMEAANAQLAQLTSGPIGSSPATQAGMKAYNELAAPSILNQEALAGRGAGGGATEALAQGATAAAVPLIQQEVSNREAAVGQYAGLDQQRFKQIQSALEAAGLPREIATAQALALYQQQQQEQQYAVELQTGSTSLFPATIGTHGVAKSHPTGQWFLIPLALALGTMMAAMMS